MLDDGPRPVTRNDFIKFVNKNHKNNLSNIVLEVIYPKSHKCKIHGLVYKENLNGKVGTFNGRY